MAIPNGTRKTLSAKDARSLPKEARELVKLAQKAGWEVWRSRTSHIQFRPPAGQVIPRKPEGHQDHRAGSRTLTLASTPTDKRALDNFRADLRGYGLQGV